MPCNDVTDKLKIQLDSSEKLESFEMTKLTCGTSVGGNLLLPFIAGETIDDILDKPIIDFVPDIEGYDDQTQFLLHKQMFAIKACGSVISGSELGLDANVFTLEEISYDADGTAVEGLLAVPLDVDKVKGCSSACANGGCGSKKKK